MRLTRLGLGALAVTGGMVFTACGGDGQQADPAGDEGSDVSVVATTTMIGDVAQRVVSCVDPEAEVKTLMPPGADPHEFAASSKEATELVKADLVLATGFGLEGGLTDVLENARQDGANVVELAPGVDPIEFGGHADHDDTDHDDHDDTGHDDHDDTGHDDHDDTGHDDHDDHGHDDHDDHGHDDTDHDDHGHDDHAGHNHGTHDPHFWLDVSRMAKAAQLMGDKLSEASGDDAYATCGTTVHDELMDTHEEVSKKLEAVPEDKRVLVTDHDAFGYFAEAYDYEVAGVVIPGGSTEAEPSAREVADLVQTIEDAGVHAIFANTASKAPVIEAVRKEVGGDLEVVSLHVGSVGEPGSATGTYEGMMLDNAELISKTLG